MVLPVTGDSRASWTTSAARRRRRRRSPATTFAIVRLLEEIEQGDCRPRGRYSGVPTASTTALPRRGENLRSSSPIAGAVLAADRQRRVDHRLERGPAPVAAGEVAGGDLADMADAEREQEAVERRARAWRRSPRSGWPTEISAQRLAAEQCAPWSGVKMSARRLDQPIARKKLSIMRHAEPSMSSAWRRDEMAQPLDPLGRADQAAGAADVDLAFLAPPRRTAAFRADGREDVGRAASRRG